jgi:hypothetical protein
MFKKLNTVLAGIILGVILPAILFFLFVMPRLSHFSALGSYYFHEIVLKFLPMFLSRCIFPNALLFFILIWRDQNQIAKGILISTGILTSALLFISFVL